MALNEIRIVVVNGGGSGGSSGAGKTKSPEQVANDASKIKNKKLAERIKAFTNPVDAATEKIAGRMSPAAAMATTMGVQIGVQFVRQLIDYNVSNIGRMTGDSNYQAVWSRRMEIVNDVVNVGNGMASGAMAGAMVGGPVGALVGLALGGLSAGMGIGFRQAERERAYQHELFRDGNSQAYNLARANYSAWTGRLR